MSFSREDLSAHIDELEQEAVSIEKTLKSFYRGVDTNRGKYVGFLNSWGNIDDETKRDQRKARKQYELWFNSSEPLVDEYMSHRIDDFQKGRKKIKKRMDLDDSLLVPDDAKKTMVEVIDLFDDQRSILESIPRQMEAEKFSAQKQISARVEKDELQRAKQLFSDDLIRSSGVLAGVALERNLLTMCEKSGKSIDVDRQDSIETLARGLYKADEIEKDKFKHLQHLGTIRNNCAHAGEDPAPDDVRRLLNDVEEYVWNK